ncbi:RNA-binding transcriptional accessory protein, partial [Lactobacillus curvatus]|nr:RNA-binding transcriptional accessory protein [Latilactobacillus curvatus]
SEVEATVETAVNKVGVNLNTASIQLLTYISGLNKTTAQNIIIYREENGKFQNRKELKRVPRLGPKAYEQAAGFLRIIDGNEALDNTD